MANGPTRVCVFNVKPNQQLTGSQPVVPPQTGSNLIDIVIGCDGVTVPSLGPASYGVPVVLNPNGIIDPSLLDTTVTVIAGVNLSLGAPLVHLYSNGGILTAELAEAGSGSPPTIPLPAQGFLTAPIAMGQPGNIVFSGLFTYIDPNSEFSLSSVGQEVYLSAVTPGGITLTRPSTTGGILDQTVGYVVAFTAPNVVTAIFLAGFNDFTRISGCLATTQLCSVQGTGAFVQLTVGAPPPSPVNTHLGTAANYAILAYSGITNASPATSVTGGVIGTQTATITGFNPPTATVDNANAAAARVAGQAAFTYFSGLTPTQTGLANLSNNNGGGGLGIYHAGVFSGGALDIPTTITLDAQGNPNALFVFISASTTVLHSGASILLVNGAQAANVVWVVGSSFTSTATSTMVGNILAYTSITLGGGILSGRALAVGGGNGAVTIPAATAITVPAGAGGTITAGDIVTFDTFGNTLDSGISLEGVLSSIFVNPMTTNGDMIYEGLTVGSPPVLGPLRLPIGTTGQVLTVVGGIPAWQTPVLPQTFTPTPAGSPPEFEYLTGYSASTGLFSAAPVPTTVPGGVTTDLQYNNAGVFGGASTLTWDNVNNLLTLNSGVIRPENYLSVDVTTLPSYPAPVLTIPQNYNYNIYEFNGAPAAFTVVTFDVPARGPFIVFNNTSPSVSLIIASGTDNFYVTVPGGDRFELYIDGNNDVYPSSTAPAGAGGSSGQLQWNNGGVLDGVTDSVVSPAGSITLNNSLANTGTVLTVKGTASGGTTPIQAWLIEGVVNAFVDHFGRIGGTGAVFNTNISIGARPTLLVQGNTSLMQDIAQFWTTNLASGASVWIDWQGGTHIAPTATAIALSVTGDAFGSDIQNWYVHAGSPPTPIPVVSIDGSGNLHLGEGLYDSTGSLGMSGQALTSTGTQVLWAAADTSVTMRSQRDSAGTVNAGTFAGPFAVTFSPAFADNNYTAEVSVELGEVPGFATVTATFTKQAAGAGLNVWILNSDSNNHTVTIHTIARHD